jgi:hypothetical protein
MYDASLGLLTSDDASVVEAQSGEFATKKGWMLKLTTSGEKVLSSPLILDYNIFFTTYIPAASNPSQCAPPKKLAHKRLIKMCDCAGLIPPARVYHPPPHLVCLATVVQCLYAWEPFVPEHSLSLITMATPMLAMLGLNA